MVVYPLPQPIPICAVFVHSDAYCRVAGRCGRRDLSRESLQAHGRSEPDRRRCHMQPRTAAAAARRCPAERTLHCLLCLMFELRAVPCFSFSSFCYPCAL